MVHKPLEHNSVLCHKHFVCSGAGHLSFNLMAPRRGLKPSLVLCSCRQYKPRISKTSDVQGVALQGPALPVETGKEPCLGPVLCTPLSLQGNISSAAGVWSCPPPACAVTSAAFMVLVNSWWCDS